MKNIEYVKKDLLRRKINEHFSNNPKSRVAIFKADIGPKKTIWRVQREGKEFVVVEVKTEREEFVLSEGFPVFEADKEKPKKKFKGPPGEVEASPNTAETPSGAESAESETTNDNPYDDSSEDKFSAEEPSVDMGPGPDAAGDSEGKGEPPPEGQDSEEGKTGEQKQLKNLVQNKPVQDIAITSESDKTTIVLTLGGLKNPIELTVHDNGKVTYKLGHLSRLLKASAAE